MPDSHIYLMDKGCVIVDNVCICVCVYMCVCVNTHTQQVDKKIKKIVANIVLTSNKCNYNHYRVACYNIIICSIIIIMA